MKCYYHSRDLDGWMSAAIVKLWNPDVELVGWDYGQPIPEMIYDEPVVLVDISFPPNILQEHFNDIIWIDHHKSAIQAWKDAEEGNNRYLPGLRDTKFAACELTWKYFFPEKPMPEIVRLLGRYDCFGHKGTDEELKVLQFQYGARGLISSVDDAFRFLMIATVKNNDMELDLVDDILLRGEAVYKYLCTEAKQIYARRATLTWMGIRFAVVNQERFNPINFGIDYHADGYDGFMCYWNQNGKWMFSLYNDNGKVDVSEVAKTKGGGGHAGASGFTIADDPVFIMTIMGFTNYAVSNGSH